MTRRPISTCDTCQAGLLWATTMHGRKVPLDATPNPAGNQLLDRSSNGLCAVQLTDAEAAAIRVTAPERLYQTHFASHPQCAWLRGVRVVARRPHGQRRNGVRR